MKIGYLLQAGVPDVRAQSLSGPALHVKHVFDELRGLGHDVKLLAQLDNQLWLTKDLVHYQQVVVPRHDRGPLRLFESLVRRIQYEFHLPYAALFESARYAAAVRQTLGDRELFYERMGWFGYAGAWAARQLRVPLVLEVNGDHLTEFEMLGTAPKGMQLAISKWLMGWTARHAAHAITTGEGWRKRHIERWDIAPDKVTSIQNGSEVVNLLAREQLRCYQASGEQNNGKLEIVYIGAFDPWHGLTILIKAAAKARARGVPLHLTVIGGGKEQEAIERTIAETEMADIVTLTGYLKAHQFAPLLAQAEIGASPYCGRAEYTGLKMLDYKAAGLVTLTSGENGQPDIIRHGETGWIVPPCNEDALAEAIVSLYRAPAQRQQMGRAAREEAERLHSWHHVAEELVNLFERLNAYDRK
ncbi:MAG: glycosyltransferase family 4 protein [Caldilineaceae bacterium]